MVALNRQKCKPRNGKNSCKYRLDRLKTTRNIVQLQRTHAYLLTQQQHEVFIRKWLRINMISLLVLQCRITIDPSNLCMIINRIEQYVNSIHTFSVLK